MGFKDAITYGIDYRDYEKVSVLPSNVKLLAVAGIWGDYSNIRCLFHDEHGKKYMRNIKGSSGNYIIKELCVNAKEIKVGTIYVVD